MNKKGFTLVELLAVIVVLGIIITIAGISVTSAINRSKKSVNTEIESNLEDAAVTYAIDNGNNFSGICQDDCINSNNCLEDCITNVTVSELINAGYFEDNNGSCNSEKEIKLYKLENSYRAVVEKGTCTK